MLDRLKEVEKRYEEVMAMLCDPQVVSQADRYRELMKESSELQPLVETYRAYAQAQCREAEARELAEASGTDRDMRELAEEDMAINHAAAEDYAERLKVLLLPKDPNDDRNVILEIRAGAGGEESALFAGSLLRMYTLYAQSRGYQLDIVNANPTELGGYKEISCMVIGQGAYSHFKFESGVHRVQRVPETEAGGRIHTSTATVAVLPEADEVELTIAPTDLQIDTFRSSGAGGQHINKTESAIRITHLPTGMVVECQDERSQYKNKEKAMRVLRSRLYEQMQEQQQSAIAADRRAQVGTGDRSERIRTYNFPQGRVTDHRIGLTLYKLEAVLNGALDELIDALITAERTEKLQRGQEHANEAFNRQ